MEALLTAVEAPPHARSAAKLYHYLISLDYKNAGHVLNAHGALVAFLAQRQIPAQPSTQIHDRFLLLLSAQPRWLDLSGAYGQGLLDEMPDLPNKSERKAWLQKEILKRFEYVQKPPRWLQAAQWPMGERGPLVFLGQLPVKNYFHDESAVYVFYDPARHECKSLIQSA